MENCVSGALLALRRALLALSYFDELYKPYFFRFGANILSGR